VITSVRNRQVTASVKLKKRGLREQARRLLVEGAQATAEALDAGAVETVFHVPGAAGRVPAVVQNARESGAEIVDVSEAVMARLTSAVTPQGLVAVARFVDVPLRELAAEGRVVPVLCSVRDPGNAGAIVRSADAGGAAGVVFTRASVDVYNPKTVRASAGSLFHLPVVREVEADEAVDHLRNGGAQVLAADARGESDAYEVDLSRPTALLFGNEAWGLTEEARRLADATVRVPIRGRAESLNLAAAAALLIFEAARQRRARGPQGGDLANLMVACVHDLRLPLTALKGFTATLVDRWDRFDDASRRGMVEGMGLDIERVSGMITLLVEAARLESGQLRRPAGRTDVAGATKWIAGVFARTPDYPDVKGRGEAQASIDPERLQAVLLALCEGAMWWGQDGPIVIESRPRDGGADVSVSRAGKGPDPDQLATMFAGPAAGGAKIGLHLAARVVEALGGSITAEGGDGVTFRVTLPG
jgi:RNA methyltransferase, TrmH family